MNKSFELRPNIVKYETRSNSIPRNSYKQACTIAIQSPKVSNTSIRQASNNYMTTPSSDIDSMIIQTERECNEIQQALIGKVYKPKVKLPSHLIEKELQRLDANFSLTNSEDHNSISIIQESIDKIMRGEEKLSLGMLQEMKLSLHTQNLIAKKELEKFKKFVQELKIFEGLLKQRENIIDEQEKQLGVERMIINEEKKRVKEDKA